MLLMFAPPQSPFAALVIAAIAGAGGQTALQPHQRNTHTEDLRVKTGVQLVMPRYWIHLRYTFHILQGAKNKRGETLPRNVTGGQLENGSHL